ncbi:hypothetical protein RchiOBHm_Chr5g0078841 [Rosa chinensis]|uniref:Uncharacterized protein n=1 Tax=Rosa chinensis TaxID=74649 RepID=A0A2P6QMB9_ROSCH|nr:hypothetical protein RchiOBHm_Chr5g0078841 [Rosa chinensis]
MHKATDNGGAYMMNLQSRSCQIWGLRIDPNRISISFTWNPSIEQGHKHICCVFERYGP